MKAGDIVTLYEVYPKRALQEPFETLVMMDRFTKRHSALGGARKWGAVVIKIKAEILTKYPLTRRIISHEIVFVHKPMAPEAEKRDKMTKKMVMGKLYVKNFIR